MKFKKPYCMEVDFGKLLENCWKIVEKLENFGGNYLPFVEKESNTHS
jgi:hypothetical protein